MSTITNINGEVIDMMTGEVVGRSESAPLEKDPRSAAGIDQEFTSNDDAVGGLINNTTWGMQSALFALPDMATLGVGKALGMKEDQVQTLGKLFNKLQVGIGGDKIRAPKNEAERYARAVGEGIGANLPFTGILAWAANKAPMVRAGTELTGKVGPSGSILKDIAIDAVDFVKRNPRGAVALDVAFGAGYEGLRQAVEENVDDSNPNKALFKELLPAAAFIGGPLALTQIPSVKLAGAAGKKLSGLFDGMGNVEKDVLNELEPGFFKLPGVKILPKMFIQNAEKKLEQVFGPIAKSAEAQEALASLKAALDDPRVAEAGFMFDAAESTMFTPLVQRKLDLLKELGPKELDAVKVRINENQSKLQGLFDSFTPEARIPIVEAFQKVQADRQGFFEAMLREQGDRTEAEIIALSERLGPQNIDAMNDELRGVLLAGMEMNADMRKNVLSRMGLRQAISPEGLMMPTRQDGKSLYDSRDMEDAATKLIEKYRIERPSARTQVPEPIRILERFVKTQQASRENMQARMERELTDESIRDQIVGLDPDVQNTVRQTIAEIMEGKAAKGRKRGVSLSDVVQSTGRNKDGNISIPTGIPGKRIVINPEQIRKDAALIAQDSTKVDINVPEALDYLTAAQRFRSDSISSYNASMMKGRTRLTDAQKIIDTGDTVFRDIEKLIMDHVPKVKKEYEGMQMVLDDYKAGYENALPLLLSSTKRGGQEFLLPNESLMQTAFSNADNLRQLRVTLGAGEQADSLLNRGAIDWLSRKPIFDKNGLVDPKKIRSVLDKNKGIVDALPENIRTKLTDEIGFADDYAARMAEINKRRIAAKDSELDNMLAKAGREDADQAQSIAAAIKDPAMMRKLVNQTGNDPELLAALRRSVFETATEGAQQGGLLSSFIQGNEKSLKVLFKNTKHLEDLKTLAELQRRVNAFAGVTGQIPEFNSLDDNLKKVFGSGLQYITTTVREAAVGRIRPETGALALLVRMAGGLENQVYNRIFVKALEDPTFAARISRISTPEQAAEVAASLTQIGVPRSFFQSLVTAPGASRAASQEVNRMARGDEELPTGVNPDLPVVGTARQMLRNLPPAPQSRGMPQPQQKPNLRAPSFQQPARPASNVNLMYPTLFPNDPISAMLQQRQAGLNQ
tara:strand:- start:3508 stop:6927 length:3420 start_codon:yes stop_codon:yes gene_type:complete